MSRHIDADVLPRHGNRGGLVHWQDIVDAPSIDIVRCGECKYKSICSQSVQYTTHDAHSVTIAYKSVDFCSYGERSE